MVLVYCPSHLAPFGRTSTGQHQLYLTANSQIEDSQPNFHHIRNLHTRTFPTGSHSEGTRVGTQVHVWDSELSTSRAETCLASAHPLLETAVGDITSRCTSGTSSMFYLTQIQEGTFSALKPTQNCLSSQMKGTFPSDPSPSHIQTLVTDKNQTLISSLSELEQSHHHSLAGESGRSSKSSSHQSQLLVKTNISNADLDRCLDKVASRDQDRPTIGGDACPAPAATTTSTTTARGEWINLPTVAAFFGYSVCSLLGRRWEMSVLLILLSLGHILTYTLRRRINICI